MMNEELNSRGDAFEQRLQRVPQSELPSAWREGILTKAKKFAASVHAPCPPSPGFLATLIQSLATLARPQRLAWGTLALLWLVIGLLNWSAPSDTAISTGQPNSLALQHYRQQQIQLLADLQAPAPVRPQPKLPPPPPSAPSPRSERRMAPPTYC